MFPLMQGVGSAMDQWREAGIDVALGRMTADELYRFGEKLFVVDEKSEEVKDLQRDLQSANWEIGDLRNEIDELEAKCKKRGRVIRKLRGY